MSAPYLGDFPADQAVYFMFSTNDADGASISPSVDGTVSVYKDNSDGAAYDLGQSTTGVLLDDDVDTVTGVHSVCITTTDAFYETGHDYTVVYTAATIDTQTVNHVLAHFSIENRFMRGTDSAALASVCTETRLSELDAATAGKMANQVDEVRTDTGEIGTAGAGLTNLGAMHLEYLFKTTYDPASKPGSADALLNELVENDAGVSRFTANTLEEVWAVAARALTDKAGFSLAADQSGVTIGTVNALAAASIVAATFGAGAIDAAAIAADAIGSSEFAQAAADKVWDTAARILTASTNFNDISTADVNTQVSDVLKTDTIAEQAQGIPPTTPTFEEAVMYLYMALTKSVDVDSALKEFYNNAGTVIWKKGLSDNSSNYVEAKGASGP